MENSLELLEEKFRKVEQERECRALYEPEPPPRDLANLPTETRKHHKKPAVSVSHFGKEEHAGGGPRSPIPSPLSAAASKSTFYHTLAHPRSLESLVSEISGDGQDTQSGEHHEIQVERIAGRQTLPSALLPRRLTRAQSQIDFTFIRKGMVVDVSVETTTEASQLPSHVKVSTAYATRPLRSRAATVGVLASHGGLVGRAKDFARRLRRKGGLDLP